MSARGLRFRTLSALGSFLSLLVLTEARAQPKGGADIACDLFALQDVSTAFGEPMAVNRRDPSGCRWNRTGTPTGGFFTPFAIIELQTRESFALQNPQGGVRLDVSNIGEGALVWTVDNSYYGWALTKAGTLFVQSDRLDVLMNLLTLGAERLTSVDPPSPAPQPGVGTPEPSVSQTVVTETGAATAEATRSTSPAIPAQPPGTFELPPPLRPEDLPRDADDAAPFEPVDPCKLFTAAEIGTALGEPVRDGAPGFLPNMCAWDTRNDDTVVIQMFAREYYEDGSRSEGGEALESLGERAFVDPWLGGFRAGALLATGAVGVISPKRDVSVALLRQAVERLR